MPSATDETAPDDRPEDPVYRWIRAFGLVGLAAFAYLLVLLPVLGVVFGAPAGSASAVGPATDPGGAADGRTPLARVGPLLFYGLPLAAGLTHVALGARLRPLGLFVVAQVGVNLLVTTLAVLLGVLTGGGADVPGMASVLAYYVLPLAVVVRDQSDGPDDGDAE